MIGPRPLLVKEARALVPLWLAIMAVIVADALTGHRHVQGLAVLAFPFGSLALGAHAIGHEYSHRTLAVLLTQPVERRRLLLTKLAVLAPLLIALGATFWYLLGDEIQPRPAATLALLPVIGGLFVAPWMTMVARSQLGGMMLTGLIGGWSMVVTNVATVNLSGLDSRAAEELALLIWLRMMYAFAVISAIVTWRMFMRLEAIEGGGREIQLPRLFAAPSTARSRQPLWSLIKKELRLQQMTFALAAIFVAIWMVAFLRDAAAGEPSTPARAILSVLSAIYLFAVAMTAGAVASAEERQTGMLESQQLLPISSRQQWFIKAAVAIGLALLLGIGPVALLVSLGESSRFVRQLLPPPHIAVLLIVIVTACGLYVSSLASSGVRALMLVFPFVIGLYLPFLLFVVWIRLPARGEAPFFGLIPFAALVLVFAGSNHRRVDRSFKRAVFQMGAAWLVAAAGVPLLAILSLRL